jgi:hypothetical protein
VEKVNEERRKFSDEISAVLDALQAFESRRLNRVGELKRRLWLFEVQAIKSLEYDVNRFFSNQQEAPNEIADFTAQAGEEFTRKRGKPATRENFLIPTPRLPWSELRASLRPETGGLPMEVGPLEALLGPFFSDAQGLALPADVFKQVEEFCATSLTQAQSSGDFAVALEILAVACKVAEAESGATLQERLYEHGVWNFLGFWEEALLAAVVESLFVGRHRARGVGTSKFRELCKLELGEFRALTEKFGLSFDTLLEVETKVLDMLKELLGPAEREKVEKALEQPKTAEPPKVAKRASR